MTEVVESLVEMRCMCEKSGRSTDTGLLIYHWGPGGPQPTRCRNTATQDDVLCEECREDHP